MSVCVCVCVCVYGSKVKMRTHLFEEDGKLSVPELVDLLQADYGLVLHLLLELVDNTLGKERNCV